MPRLPLPPNLAALEAESIFILREVAAECERPALLYSGGKDSAVVLHLAGKAFFPGGLPFPLLHIDTGHNYPEVINYRDEMAERYQAKLIVRTLDESISRGTVILRHPLESRNAINPSRSLRPLPNWNSMPASEVQGETRRRPEPKSAFSASGTA